MPAKVYNSFAITISLKEHFEGPIQEWFITWLSKQDFAYGVIEKRSDGIRHAHAQIWNESPSKKGDVFGTSFKSKILKYSPDAVVLGNKGALHTKIAYNDCYVDYAQKDIEEELISNLPQLTDKYYPSKEEQERVMEESNAIDKTFHKMLVDFKESDIWVNEEWTPRLYDCGVFLADMMFNKKLYRVVQDPKRRRELCKSLFHYSNGSICPKEFMSEKDYTTYEKTLPPAPAGSTEFCPHACSCCPYFPKPHEKGY